MIHDARNMNAKKFLQFFPYKKKLKAHCGTLLEGLSIFE